MLCCCPNCNCEDSFSEILLLVWNIQNVYSIIYKSYYTIQKYCAVSWFYNRNTVRSILQEDGVLFLDSTIEPTFYLWWQRHSFQWKDKIEYLEHNLKFHKDEGNENVMSWWFLNLCLFIKTKIGLMMIEEVQIGG